MFNIFCTSPLKTKKKSDVQKAVRYENYKGILTESLAFMFKREGLPKELRQNFIEPLLLQFGVCAVWFREDLNEYVASVCSFGGNPYADGLGSKAICSCFDGKVVEFDDWKKNNKVAVLFNNITKTDDLALEFTADMLSEIDGAITLQVKHSKLYPIPIVHDAKEKNAVEDILAKIDTGEEKAMISDNVFDEVMGKEGRGVYTLDLTRPEMSDHIQYLTHAKDDVWRFWWQLYGMNSQGTSKMAQQSVEEVTNNDCASLTIPLERLEQRRLDTEIMNEKFGWSVTVDFSEAWKTRVERAEDVNADDVEETPNEDEGLTEVATEENTENNAEENEEE